MMQFRRCRHSSLSSHSFGRLLVLAFALLSFLSPRHAVAQTTAPADDPNSDDPEVERRLLQLPPGFDIQLFASEPLLQRPVSMSFRRPGPDVGVVHPALSADIAGAGCHRLHRGAGGYQGKGRADKSHIFVSGLRVATGMVPDDAGGAYVGEGDLLLHFKDHTGSGKSDERQIVFSGFGTADNPSHAQHLFLGPDGLLYFNQGWYINSSIERRAACAAGSAAASGNSTPIRSPWKSTTAPSR